MESLKEYISEREEEKLNEEYLTEDPATIVMTVLALPSLVAVLAWGASWVATSYVSVLTKIASSISRMWKKMFSSLKGNIDAVKVKNEVKQMARDPKTRRVIQETQKKRKAFEDELEEVYTAIEEKDFDTAKQAFSAAPKEIQNNPDAHKVIIAEISRSLKEPPLYVTSPGNKTYKAIKKVLNIRIARAAAMATKMAIEKELQNDSVRNVEREVEEE